MRPPPSATDEELLTSGDPEAFGVFYDRHVRTLLGYFARRTGDPEIAADLTAETFACALAARPRFKPGGPPAIAWLFTIAQRRLADYRRRGRVEDRIRRSLAMERRELSSEDIEVIRMLGNEAATALLAALPSDQRTAVAAHVVAGDGYADIAAAAGTSQATIRQRVSRGL